MTPPIITASNVAVSYGKNEEVLSGITFELEAGKVHGLVGANGVGKTTLLRAIAGQLPATGSLSVFGADPFDNLAVMDHTVLMGIDSPFLGSWTVTKILKIAKARWAYWNQAYAAELLNIFGVDATKHYGKLSRGQRSSVGITVALASGCQLVLLDEPYLGLDAEKRQEFYRIIAAESRNRTIVISTHHLNEVSNLLDTVLLIDDSGTVLAGAINDLTEAILEVIGSNEAVSRFLSVLDMAGAVIYQEEQAGSTKLKLDLRARQSVMGKVYQIAVETGVKVTESTLESAVLAVTGRNH